MMQKAWFLGVFVLFVLFSGAYAQQTAWLNISHEIDGESRGATATIYVKDEQDAPVDGAYVTVYYEGEVYQTLITEQGAVSFDLNAPGSYSVEVKKQQDGIIYSGEYRFAFMVRPKITVEKAGSLYKICVDEPVGYVTVTEDGQSKMLALNDEGCAGYAPSGASFVITTQETSKLLPASYELQDVLMPQLIVTVLPEKPKAGTSFTVFVKADGLPVSGAKVVVADWTLTTDDKGMVMVTVNKAGNYVLNVSKDGYLPASKTLVIYPNVSDDTNAPTMPALNIAVDNNLYVDKKFTVTVTVNGVPVQDATVTLDFLTATTDASGKVTFKVDKPGRYTITATKPGYVKGVLFIQVREAPKKIPVISISPDRVMPGQPFTVHVTVDGKPAGNITIVVGENTYTTDGNGEVRMVLDEPGQYYVVVDHPGYQRQSFPIKVNELETKPVVILIDPSEPFAMQPFRVRLLSRGQPVEGALVKVAGQERVTNFNGTVSFTINTPGQYTLVATKPGYQVASQEVKVKAPPAPGKGPDPEEERRKQWERTMLFIAITTITIIFIVVIYRLIRKG
jgi:uncharacterized GH25 family protein